MSSTAAAAATNKEGVSIFYCVSIDMTGKSFGIVRTRPHTRGNLLSDGTSSSTDILSSYECTDDPSDTLSDSVA